MHIHRSTLFPRRAQDAESARPIRAHEAQQLVRVENPCATSNDPLENTTKTSGFQRVD